MEQQRVEWLDEQSAFESHCQRWAAQGWFCFDTEFIRDDTFLAQLCLIQVSDGQSVTLIDPFGLDDIRPFWELLLDANVTSIVHAGKEDFDVCMRATEKPPRNVFDVQVAAGFVGFGYPLSLSRLVLAVLHKRLTKGQTLTDWTRRPLTEEQRRYAVDDVRYLPALYETLGERLHASSRSEWAAEEFARFEDPDLYRPAVEDRLFKLKGSRKLDGLGLAVLAELVRWREAWATRRNRPVRTLMRDDILVEIAKRRPTRPAQLEVLRGFPQSRNRKVVRELLDVVAQASRTPPEQWPTPHKPRDDTPMTRVTLDLLSAYLHAVCFEEEIAAELVGGAQKLRELCDYDMGRSDDLPALLRGWRKQFIGQRLLDLLAGRCELRLTGWPDDPRLRVVTQPARGQADQRG